MSPGADPEKFYPVVLTFTKLRPIAAFNLRCWTSELKWSPSFHDIAAKCCVQQRPTLASWKIPDVHH